MVLFITTLAPFPLSHSLYVCMYVCMYVCLSLPLSLSLIGYLYQSIYLWCKKVVNEAIANAVDDFDI